MRPYVLAVAGLGLAEDGFLFLDVDLDAATGVVDDGDATLFVDPHTAGVGEVPLVGGVVGVGNIPLPNHVGVGIQLVLAPLGEGGVADELGDETAVGSEDLHPVVHPVGNVNVAVGVDTESVGAVELPDTGAAGADGLLPLAIVVEDLYAVIAPVGDVDVVVLVDSDAPGYVELAGAAALRAEAADVLAVEGGTSGPGCSCCRPLSCGRGSRWPSRTGR